MEVYFNIGLWFLQGEFFGFKEFVMNFDVGVELG